MTTLLKKVQFMFITIIVTLSFSACKPAGQNKELSEKQAKNAAVSELQKILSIETEPEDISLYYQNNQLRVDQGEGTAWEVEYRAYWRADCSFAEGDDYQIWLNAADGKATNLYRYPQDWFDTQKDHGDYSIGEPQEHSEEEFLRLAESYCEKAGYQIKESYGTFRAEDNLMLNNPGDTKENGRTRWPVNYYKITVMYADEGGASIALCVDDMSFLGAWFVPFQ